MSFFERVLIEQEILQTPFYAEQAEKIVEQLQFPWDQIVPIEKVEQSFGRFKKPYLDKRHSRWLYLGIKKGQLIKVAPPAYGLGHEPHYYFVHAYNCLYECSYCYLQGHFNSPDTVWYLNHQDITEKMQEILQHHGRQVWFHAGEFSDSLAWSHITGEVPHYLDFFQQHPEGRLEFRTKSVNTRAFLQYAEQKRGQQSPPSNVTISFSLMPEAIAKLVDLKAPPIPLRLEAMLTLKQAGYKLAIHFDPIIMHPLLEKNYAELIEQIAHKIGFDHIQYVSLGVVRFTAKVYQEVERNYPEAPFVYQGLKKGAENLVRYTFPERHSILRTVDRLLKKQGMAPENIYWCMEENSNEIESPISYKDSNNSLENCSNPNPNS